ncbi:MAG: sugar ABC transporter permease, partial [Alphaproteobacteria bacterium]
MVAQQFEPAGNYADIIEDDAQTERRNAWVRLQDRIFVPLTVVPTVVASVLVFGIPLAFSLLLSFQGWKIDSGLLAGKFVGFANYQDLFTDPLFVSSLYLTMGYTVSTVTVELLLGLGVALLLNSRVPFVRIFRTALIIPMMITPIVAALTWKLLLDPTYGLVNAMLGTNTVWLGDP